MKNKIIAKRYAEGYIAYAKPKIGIQLCVDEMKGLKWILRENPEFSLFLKAPEVSMSEKFGVIDRIFNGRYSEEFQNFLKYIITKGRFDNIGPIVDYIRIAYSHGEAVDVILRTTFPLELEIIEKIKTKLEERSKKKVNLYLELDPDLLGGVQMVIGNTIIDGSVKHKLVELRKQLLKVQVTR